VACCPAGWCAVYEAGGCIKDAAAEAHKKGVHANFAAVHAAARALGGVPEMLSPSDFIAHGPDERAVILYAAFLCSRLLEVSKEERAAHVIQSAWRLGKAKAAGEAQDSRHRYLSQCMADTS
jgi:abnormal spindle-like microcephaly-associated protein